MRVHVYPADADGGCGFYRMREPARALKAQGHDVTVQYGKSYDAWWQPTVFGDRPIKLAKKIRADVAVLQRPLRRDRYHLIELLQAEGIAVVVEVDDDFHAIHPRNPAYLGTNPLHDPDLNRDWLKKACARADLVTVTTPALAARYGAHGRVAVIPNYVPERYLNLSGVYARTHLPRPPGLLAGWSGSVATHPTDLDVCGTGIASALARSGAGFRVIGTGAKVAERLGLAEQPSATGWLPLDAYPEGLAQLDVGIVPLAMTNFNEAKSWLKGLEYAAVGVPFVATPTGPYRDLAEHGIGWLASTPEEWADKVSQLLTDHALREELSIEWQRIVRRQFTLEENCWRWWHAWQRARLIADERQAA